MKKKSVFAIVGLVITIVAVLAVFKISEKYNDDHTVSPSFYEDMDNMVTEFVGYTLGDKKITNQEATYYTFTTDTDTLHLFTYKGKNFLAFATRSEEGMRSMVIGSSVLLANENDKRVVFVVEGKYSVIYYKSKGVSYEAEEGEIPENPIPALKKEARFWKKLLGM